MKRFSKQEIFSIPNLMGYFRILMIPVFCYLYIGKKMYLEASAVVLLSSLIDLFDGKIARKFNMVTELGKFLDPVADKMTHGALALCLAVHYPLMWALILLLIVKEGYMAVMGAVLLKKGKKLNGAMWFGKVCTAVLFAGLLTLFLFPHLPLFWVNSLILVMMAVMIFALLNYIPVFRQMKQEADRQSGESLVSQDDVRKKPQEERTCLQITMSILISAGIVRLLWRPRQRRP